MFGLNKQDRVATLERKIMELEDKNQKLEVKLIEKKRLFHPRKSKEITVSPYIFNKYIKHVGSHTITDFRVYCEDGTYYYVKVDENMRDGYIRYEEPIEEPHTTCKSCRDTFQLDMGYPRDRPDFCTYDCYNQFLSNKQRG